MSKQYFIGLLLLFNTGLHAQELFVLTEPASNMAAKSLGIRAMNSFMNELDGSGINYHLMPEIMWGINNKWMLHAQGFLSNRNNRLVTEGGSLYAKYRFLSIDDVHSHFRMATYGRLSINNSDIHQDEIETMGHNSGYELGLIATQLLHKVAISASASYEKAMDNGSAYKFPSTQSNNAINYTLSVGKLMLPKEYTSYNQTNVNLMVEMLGQSLSNGKSFLDIAPSVQLIIQSQARIDFGYRYQLHSNMHRTAPNGFIVKFEYNLFSIFK
jgi:hypothetical protein